jgi:hypothetical protein
VPDDDDDDGPASGRVIDGTKAKAFDNKQAMAKTRTERIMVINGTVRPVSLMAIDTVGCQF